MVGQFLWCFAHTLWIGNSFTLTTSFGLVAHHLFGVWHGDKRLSEKHGEAYEVLKKRTSVIPFAAILDGRQKLPEEYYKEFLRLPYFVIAVITVGAYWSQPILQGASRYLKWWVTVPSQISSLLEWLPAEQLIINTRSQNVHFENHRHLQCFLTIHAWLWVFRIRTKTIVFVVLIIIVEPKRGCHSNLQFYAPAHHCK